MTVDDAGVASIDLGEEILSKESASSSSLAAGMSKARLYAIDYIYVEHFGTAPEHKRDDFDDFGRRLPTLVMKHLMIP